MSDESGSPAVEDGAGTRLTGDTADAAGRATAEEFDPIVEDAYWRENYSLREYYQKGRDYSYYQSAYRYGWESRKLTPGHASFEDSEHRLQRHWVDRRGESQLTWEEARPAARDAWNRVALRDPGP